MTNSTDAWPFRGSGWRADCPKCVASKSTCDEHYISSAVRITEDDFSKAHAETVRLQNELDITNADHIALWLEANMPESSIGWMACRIVEAHEQGLALASLASQTPEVEPVAAIVAWLREQSEIGAEIGITKDKGTTGRAAFGGGSLALKRAADAIERGEYLTDPNVSTGGISDTSADGAGEVAQGDRDAAAANIVARLIAQNGGEQPWMDASTASMRMGEQDHHWEVQAFKNHRLATLQPDAKDAEIAGLREALEPFAKKAAQFSKQRNGLVNVEMDFAHFRRALKALAEKP